MTDNWVMLPGPTDTVSEAGAVGEHASPSTMVPVPSIAWAR